MADNDPSSDPRLDRLRHDLETTGTFEGQAINYRADGTPFVMSWRIAAVVEADGTTSGYVAIQDDATRVWLDQLREHETITALQQSLLPAGEPAVAGLELATAYRPADDTSRLGGDWYDIVEAPGGEAHLVVGDVTGHGLASAAHMGRFRWALAALLGETWPHFSGVRLGLARLAIDTGYEAPAVYAWARRQGWGQVLPLKGAEGFNRSAPVSGPTHVDATEGGVKIRRGARLWTVAVATFKSETYRFLRSAAPADDVNARHPAGSIHLPRGVDAEWVKQLVAEQLITVKTRRGFTRLEWQKLRERNEAFDCSVYARAAAWIAGIDRWPERKWRELEAQLGVKANQAPSVTLALPPHAPGQTEPAPPASMHGPRRRGGRWLRPRSTSWLSVTKSS